METAKINDHHHIIIIIIIIIDNSAGLSSGAVPSPLEGDMNKNRIEFIVLFQTLFLLSFNLVTFIRKHFELQLVQNLHNKNKSS